MESFLFLFRFLKTNRFCFYFRFRNENRSATEYGVLVEQRLSVVSGCCRNHGMSVSII